MSEQNALGILQPTLTLSEIPFRCLRIYLVLITYNVYKCIFYVYSYSLYLYNVYRDIVNVTHTLLCSDEFSLT